MLLLRVLKLLPAASPIHVLSSPTVIPSPASRPTVTLPSPLVIPTANPAGVKEPIVVLLSPVVFNEELEPTALLRAPPAAPPALSSACQPKALLLEAVVLSWSASAPTAVLFVPVVLEVSAKLP